MTTKSLNELSELCRSEKLAYKKCCNYACECGSDCLRKLLGDAANESRMRLGISSDELKND